MFTCQRIVLHSNIKVMVLLNLWVKKMLIMQ